MRKHILLLILVILHYEGAHAERYTAKISTYPDFTQGDTRYGTLPKSGATHCGPVAVSNALVGLSKNGFPELVAVRHSNQKDQFDLILEISSTKYMKTSNKTGTKPKNVVAGLEKYVKSKGYGIQIETMGWRSKAKRIGRVPSLPWIVESTNENSNVVLNIGWYRYDHSINIYQRTNGHYVTVVGFESNNNNIFLYIHDPALRDGLSKKTLKCATNRLKTGAKLRLSSGKTEPAKGFFEISCLKIKRGNDLAIVDGAIAFTVL